MMNSPFSLFWFRLKKEWHYQYDAFRSAVDWIIWLYIIVPIIALVFYQYYLLWQGTASWVEWVPLPFLFLFLFILCWTGCIRLFLTEGDLLFLRQNKKWQTALMRFGILYSIVLNILFTMVISVIVIPILYLYAHYSIYHIGLFLSFLLLYRLFIQFTKQIVFVSFSGLQLIAIKVVLFIASLTVYGIFYQESTLVQLFILCIVIIILPLLYRIRMKRTWCFFEDCVREGQQRLKITSIFIQASGYQSTKPLFKRERPLLFYNSASLFKRRNNRNLLRELLLKFILRGKNRFAHLYQITIICILAIVFVPFWVKWLVLLFGIYCVIHLTRSYWKEVTSHSFYRLYRTENKEEIDKAVKDVIFFITVPSIFSFGFVAGLTGFSLLYGFLIAILSICISYFIIRDIWVN